MPDNDILRFFIVLIGMMFAFAVIYKIIDVWAEGRKNERDHDQRLLQEMKEMRIDDEDDPESR